MPASRILCLARVSRLLIVSNGTRNARAISSVERPPSVRSVSPTCASSASAGWQQVKISSSRSSGNVAASSIVSSDPSRSSRSSCSVFAASVRSRRIRSIARLRAVAISQPTGLAGVSPRGQRSAAIANASWAASSASSMSPRKPTSEATTRPHSSRKTCSSIDQRLLEDRTDLDPAHALDLLQLVGDGEGAVEVVRLDEDEAAEEILAVHKRPVGQQSPALLVAHRRRRIDVAQTQPAGHVRSRQHLGDPGVDAPLLLLGSLLASVDVAVGQECVSQDVSFPRG